MLHGFSTGLPDQLARRGHFVKQIKDSFWIALPEAAAKLNQVHYWGSAESYQVYAGRGVAEGVFDNTKNPRTENIRRGLIQEMGIVWVHLIMTLAVVTYNMRVIRNRDKRMTTPRQGYVLLSFDAETLTHVPLISGQEQNLFEEYFKGICQDDLEIAAGPRS